jgi:hypothetical protein
VAEAAWRGCNIGREISDRRDGGLSQASAIRYFLTEVDMSLACFFGSHRPSLTSIARRPFGLVGLCDGCGRPMHKTGEKWSLADPLDSPAVAISDPKRV